MNPPPSPPARGSLLRTLGVAFGLAVTVGNAVGSGILRTPGELAALLPHRSWLIAAWLAGAGLMFIAASSYAELATSHPRSAGQYTFPLRAFGRYPAFVIGIGDWLACAGSTSAAAFVTAEYVGLLFPPMAEHTELFAMGIVVFFALLQWAGVKTSARAQNLTTMLKGAGFLVLVVWCFLTPAAKEAVALPALAGKALLVNCFIAMQSLIFTYTGWEGMIYFGEEARNSARDVPRSIFGGAAGIAAIYLALNVAVLRVVPVMELAHSKLALATAARSIWGGNGERALYAMTVVFMLSTLNAFNMMTCRVIYSMSVDRLAPAGIQRVNRGGTPDIALLLSTAVSLLLLSGGSFNFLLSVLAFFFALNFVAGLSATFLLRRKQPDLDRPYRAWGYPWTTGFALGVYVAFLIGIVLSDPRNSLYALMILAATLPLFMLLQRSRVSKEWFTGVRTS